MLFQKSYQFFDFHGISKPLTRLLPNIVEEERTEAGIKQSPKKGPCIRIVLFW